SLLNISAYRFGGGSEGNVGRHTLTVLKSTVPYVASQTNRRAAFGGRDPENIESAMLRAPRVVRSHNRAVTASDFETLALEASAAVARARCIQPRFDLAGGPPPGSIHLMVIPAISSVEGMLLPEQLVLYPQLKEELDSFLYERRILTTQLVISEPDYVWVSIEATVRIASLFDVNRVRRDIETECHRFINPLTGGPDGTGWPFGRALAIADVFSILQRVSGVEDTEECRIVPVDVTTEERGEATLRLVLNHREVLCSHVHRITVVQE
ncbi:MAG TPA: putative baseplate assembly protein, partial [Dehalococcoidia bacterium]|nr:putative baseplate assembly protein [Dehalococcoidia bacterium]